MAKPDLGTKRLCGSCGAKFYDLSKTPIICPKCETVFVVTAAPVSRAAAAAAAAAATAAAVATAARAKAKEDADALENQDVELVSLEDADAESTGSKKGDVDDELEVEETEEAPFIEETEDGDDDVTDIIGDGHETEEES